MKGRPCDEEAGRQHRHPDDGDRHTRNRKDVGEEREDRVCVRVCVRDWRQRCSQNQDGAMVTGKRRSGDDLGRSRKE